MESISENFTKTHKYHRSCKTLQYTCSTASTRRQCKTIQGYFDRLPPEVLDMIFECLSVLDISVFSMVSKGINNYIMGYVSTQTWRKKMIMPKVHHPASPTEEDCILDHYRSLGVLFKRCTLLLPTKERLKFIHSKFSQVPCFTMERCSASPGCLGFASYGVFLQTLIAGWDELECHRVFNFLCEFTNLPRKIETIVNGKPGMRHRLELQIRLFCRKVLLDPWQNPRDTLFWLTRLLKLWPMVSQARLLFVLYGPLHPDGKIGWHEMLDGVVAQCGLWDLAKAITLLYSEVEAKDWSADTLFGIIEEITVLPEAWHMENMARLLVLCGNNVCYSVLASRAVNRRFPEISRLMVFFHSGQRSPELRMYSKVDQVCEKDGICMSWPVRMMQQICKVFPMSEDKWSFIKGVENMLSEVAMEMYDVIMAGDRNGELDSFRDLCNLLNASSHFHTEMVYKFLQKDGHADQEHIWENWGS